MILSPDDSLAWITYPFGSAVDVIDTLTSTVSHSLKISGAFDVAFDSAGTRAFVTNRSANSVLVIDTTTYATVKSISVPGGPVEIRIAPDDVYAVVTSFDGNSLTYINLVTYTTSGVPTPGSPMGLALVQ